MNSHHHLSLRSLSRFVRITVLSIALVVTIATMAMSAAPEQPVVTLATTKGEIRIQLRPDQAPTTCANFVDLIKRGVYNGTTFHRYEPDFVVQEGT